MVRVRRVSGPHRPSPFAKGGGVGEGDSTRGRGPRRAAPWARGPGPGDRRVAPTCCLLISHRDTENTGGMFSRLGTRPLGEAAPRPYPLPANFQHADPIPPWSPFPS